MKKSILTVMGVFALFAFESNAQENGTAEKKETPPAAALVTEAEMLAPPVTDKKQTREMKEKESSRSGIHVFKVTDINGKEFDFSTLKGKKILIVNTASNCGYTPQYKELEELNQQMKGKLVIVGFPSNDFGGQEPGTNQQIAQFCQKNYGVTFPMMEKISINSNEVYAYLTQKRLNNFKDSTVEWNFQKYLIDESGKLIGVFPSKVSPLSPELKMAIEKK